MANAHIRFARDSVLCFRKLVDDARKQEGLLWYTPMHPDTPLHKALPLNTAVALPISLSVLRRDLCFVFFAEHDVKVSRRKKLTSPPGFFVLRYEAALHWERREAGIPRAPEPARS